MKILILANLGQGLYRFRKELIEKLCFENEVFISLPDSEYDKEFTELGCELQPIAFNRRGKNPFSDVLLFWKYIKLLKKIKPDLVLTYTIKPNIYGGLACRCLKKKYVPNITGLGTAIENGGIMQWLTMFLYRLAMKTAHCIFFQNSSNMEFFKKARISKAKYILIPGSGVNLSENNVEPYPKDESAIKFLFIGRVMKNKGIEELIDATKKVHSIKKNIFLDIVGGCEEDYWDFILDAKKTGFIEYHSHQKDVHRFIKESHCTVLPSYHEGLANVLLETAATARPIIATRVPGCRETFEEGVTGFGCEAHNAESLTNAMLSFVDVSNAERKKMGLLGREKIENEFDRSLVIEAYMKVISEIEENNHT